MNRASNEMFGTCLCLVIVKMLAYPLEVQREHIIHNDVQKLSILIQVCTNSKFRRTMHKYTCISLMTIFGMYHLPL